MKDGPNIVAVAALIGDQARAEVLTALMSGQALTATELADLAGVTRQTMSSHLARLSEAGLIAATSQGRHRYFRIASGDVAQLLETLMGVAFKTGALRLRSSPREPALRKARVCYDHLAGELGVLVYDALLHKHALRLGQQGLELTAAGAQLLHGIGIDTGTTRPSKRPLCRNCLDWSERRDHLAGALGAVLLQHIIDLGWAKHVVGTRVIAFSAAGENALRDAFDIPAQRLADHQPAAAGDYKKAGVLQGC